MATDGDVTERPMDIVVWFGFRCDRIPSIETSREPFFFVVVAVVTVPVIGFNPFNDD